MEKRIQLLDISVDLASTWDASSATIEYLQDVSSKVVYFVNSKTLLLLQENDEWRAIVEESNLILPGNASVDDSINEVLGHKRDPFFVESYFDDVFDYAIETGLDIMLVAEDKNKLSSVQENLHAKRPYLSLTGLDLSKYGDSMDAIVNEINSVAPDILIMTLKEQMQLELLKGYRNQMNARLMLFTGNILYKKAVSEAEVPESVQKLKVTNLYKWFLKGERIRTLVNNIKVKMQVKQHSKEKKDGN